MAELKEIPRKIEISDIRLLGYSYARDKVLSEKINEIIEYLKALTEIEKIVEEI